MLLITLAAVLVFYFMGMTINQIGIQNVRNDMQAALQTHTEYAADQLNQEIERLKFFMLEMLSDRNLLRFAITHEVLTDWERLSYIRALSSQEYQIKRFSPLLNNVVVMFPSFGKMITTEQTQYVDLDEELWQALYTGTERGKVSMAERDGQLWLLLPRYDVSLPMFMIAFSVSPDELSARLARLANDQTRDLSLLRADGSVLASCGNAENLLRARAGSDKDMLLSGTVPVTFSLSLVGCTMVDEAMEPFVLYRAILWVLTALALVLLGTYLFFYRRLILRPINELIRSMRRVEQDTRYRIESSGHSDYDDLYVQFNHMVDHIEHLASQLYE